MNRARSHTPVLSLIIMMLVLIFSAANRSSAVPVIFNASETAQPGDIIYCQGAWGVGATLSYQIVTGAMIPSSVAATPLAVTTEGTTSADATPGQAYIAAKIPTTASFGLYAVWVTDGSGTSAVQYVNRAHGVQVEFPAIAPGFTFRIFGRNLLLSGFTPTVTFVDEAAPYTPYPGTVTTAGSDGNVLWVTAPTALVVGHTYNLILNNGTAGISGNSTVEPDNPSLQGVKVQWAQETVTPATPLNSGTAAWNLNVPWQADYLPFCSTVFNARTQYGAVGDGTTNDAPAIQAAINAAGVHGGTVYLPTGTYRLDFYSGDAGGYQGILNLPPKVVLIGDGAGKSLLKFGYEAVPSGNVNIAVKRSGTGTTGLINLELDNVETTSPGAFLIRPTDGWGSEFFVQNCVINSQTAQAVSMTGGQYGLLANSTLTCTNESESHSCFNGEANVTIYNNTYTFNMGRSWSGGIHDIIFDSNHVTRAATSPGVPGHEAGFADWWGDHVVFLNNIFDVGNTTTDITQDNDGEVLLTEQSGGGYRATGTVTSADANTLTDANQAFTPNCYVPNPATGPFVTPNSYMIAIVSGPGTGQWRYLTGNTATTVTVSAPWAVIPTAGSHYTLLQWSANEWLVKNNTFSNNYRGLVYFSSTNNCVTVGNTFTNDDGIGWTAYQAIGVNGPTDNVFHVQWNQQAYNNTVGVTAGTTYTWPSRFMIMQDVVNPTVSIFGTAVLGFEARHNSLTAHVPNLMDGEGFLGEQYQNMLVDENHWPRYAPADTSNIGISGVIFQNNTAINQQATYLNPYTHATMASGAYWIGTGVYATTIADPINLGVGSEIYDQLGGIPGGTQAAYPSAFSAIDYQCEDGLLTGSVTGVGTDWSASGGKYVGGLNSTGSSDTLSNVDGGMGGAQTLTITYATPTAALDHLYINGAEVAAVPFPATGAWSNSLSAWRTVSLPVTLNANTSNTIKIQRDAGDTAINLDKFMVQPAGMITLASTTTALTSSAAPSAAGQSVTLTATVTGNGPTGTVTFTDTTAGAALGAAAVNGGTATFSPSGLSVGSHAITASYGGDVNNSASTSSPFTQTVIAAPTANAQTVTTLLNQPAAVTLSGADQNAPPLPLTYTVTVSPAYGTLSGAAPNLTYTPNPGYIGTDSFLFTATNGTATSSPATVSLTINPLTVTTTVVTSSLNPSASDQNVLLTVTVTGNSPTGTVTFFDGTTALGTGTLSSGVATLALSALSAGSHTITAGYAGDAGNAASVSQALTQTVRPAAKLASVSASPSSVTGGVTNAMGIVALTGRATSTQVITLSSSNPAALSVPSSVTINPTYTTVHFTATSHLLTTAALVTLTATLNGVTTTTTVTVTPAPPPSLSSITASPGSIVGGSANTTGTVTLSGIASVMTGVIVTSSNPAALSVAYTINIGPGYSAHSFTATSHPVTTSTTVTLTAALNGVKQTATVTVTP